MNRIAGILCLDKVQVASEQIQRMLRVLKGRARVPQGIWIGDEVGLGCTRIENGSQGPHEPLLAFCFHGDCVLTFDGRIDNRGDLLAVLRPPSPGERSHISDEELVLAAYEKWDVGCPKHLIGDFAFALWDRKKHRLLCARDHFGVKPFYYALLNDRFVFASTPGALLASGIVPLAIQEERIADFLVNPLEGVDKSSTFYRSVYRLSPAHRVVISNRGTGLDRYRELCPAVHATGMTDDDYVEAFRELLSEAVRCCLQKTAEPASMLSGGMDSSAIVAMGRNLVAEAGQDPLHALAFVSKQTGTNRETSAISAVVRQGNIQPHLITETDVLCCLDELVEQVKVEAEPFDCLMNLNRAIYLHAREHMISSLLDGIDGDGLLASAGYLPPLWRRGSYRTIMQETVGAGGLTGEYRRGKELFLGSFASAFLPVAPDWLRHLRRPIRDKKVLRAAVKDTLIEPEFAYRVRLGERFAALDSHRPRSYSMSQTAAHQNVLEHPFLVVGLERYERVASSFGIEARHPYTDIRLTQFCLGLPWHLKTRRGWTKMILRRAMEPYLPSDVIWRKDKDSLMWEVNRLILKAKADYFYQITLDEQANLKPYIDMPKLMKFWNDYRTFEDETHAALIWTGIALAMWLRRQRKMQADL